MPEETAASKPAPAKQAAPQESAPRQEQKRPARQSAPASNPMQQAPKSRSQTKLSMPSWGGPSPMQNLILGMGLVGLNIVTQTDLTSLFARIWTAPKSAAEVKKTATFSGGGLLSIAGEAVFVLVLSFVSGFSSTMARGVFLFWLALYLVWLVFNGQKLGLLGTVLTSLTPKGPSGQLNSATKKG